MPEAHEQLMEILSELEKHYKDMQDTEFTIEDGQLFMLQTRNAKRPAQAAVRFACDAVDEGLLSKEEALATIDAGAARRAAAPDVRPQGRLRGAGQRRQRLAGRGQGRDRVHRQGGGGRPSRTGATSSSCGRSRRPTTSRASTPPRASSPPRAARPRTRRWWRAGWGARRWWAPASLKIDLGAKTISVNGTTVGEGDFIAIDGTKGCVTLEDVPLIDARVDEYFDRVLEWADELRRLGVRANADDPDGAKKARELGAEGIGLCRTEHMFMAEDRQPKMRAMIMADERGGAARGAGGAAAAPAGGLRGAVRGDGRPAGHDPAARPAAARVPPEPARPVGRGRAGADRVLRRPREARGHAQARERDPRGEPDARHARLPAGDPLPRDLRDAGRGDHARHRGGARALGRGPARRDHDPARRLRARARAPARARRSGSATSRG